MLLVSGSDSYWLGECLNAEDYDDKLDFGKGIFNRF